MDTEKKSLHAKVTLDKKILPSLLPGFELATFRSRVRRSTNEMKVRVRPLNRLEWKKTVRTMPFQTITFHGKMIEAIPRVIQQTFPVFLLLYCFVYYKSLFFALKGAFFCGDVAQLDRHAADAMLIPRCGKEVFSKSRLPQQTLSRVSIHPRVQSRALTSVRMLKILKSTSEFGGLWKH